MKNIIYLIVLFLILSCSNKIEGCEEISIPSWHNGNELGLEGGSKEIRKIFSEIQKSGSDIIPPNGFITLKVHINPNGEICSIESFQIDQDYEPISFNNDVLVNGLEKKVKQIDGWLNKLRIKSFFLIRFKIKDGRISEIF